MLLLFEYVGKTCGLALMWEEETVVNGLSYTLHNIDANIILENEDEWHFTYIYGWPDREDKHHTIGH